MQQRATRKQMQDRREKEAYQRRYDFWKEMDMMFRLISFKHIQELEKDNEVKSLEYQVLDELTYRYSLESYFKHIQELEKDNEVKSLEYQVLDELTEGMNK